MPSAALHPLESQRLATLRALDVLDSGPEETFDRLTRLACRMFNTSIAAISLIDERRQWFKSSQGLSASQMPREDAFCAHAILSHGVTSIEDAVSDPRVCDNRLVVGAPGLRFYAGAPLYAANHLPIGAFCVCDTKPREWTAAHDQMLADLAGLASDALDARLHAKRAAAAVQAKRHFVANMSHEIRTPLNVILGHAELLSQASLDASQQRGSIEAIARSARLFAGVTDAILNFAAMDANHVDLQPEDFDPARLLEEIRPMIERSAAQRGLSLQIQFCGSTGVCVRADLARIRQVLLSLLTNAIRFTPSGSVTAVGFIESTADADPLLHFVVSDTGPGFTPEQFVAALEPFSQLDNTSTRVQGGLGLGLTLADGIVRSMGGNMTLVSRPGQGSTFDITIPAAAPLRASALEAPQGVVSGSLEEKPLTGRRILVAEDCVDNHRLVSLMLRNAGAEVTIAPNGAKALQAVEQEASPFDAILMDMQMPVMDGCQATERLRSSGYRAPILALTANATPHDREAFCAAGCDEFLTKPCPRGQLISRLAELPPARSWARVRMSVA